MEPSCRESTHCARTSAVWAVTWAASSDDLDKSTEAPQKGKPEAKTVTELRRLVNLGGGHGGKKAELAKMTDLDKHSMRSRASAILCRSRAMHLRKHAGLVLSLPNGCHALTSELFS
eukprot:COSAG06_NODE_913_length_11579_cov_25.672387_3_plen_117_part_00